MIDSLPEVDGGVATARFTFDPTLASDHGPGAARAAGLAEHREHGRPRGAHEGVRHAVRGDERGGQAAGRDADAVAARRDEIIAAIWGRMPIQDPQNSLAVLVLRARKDIKAAGFDPWLIERRRGRTRLRVGEVILDG